MALLCDFDVADHRRMLPQPVTGACPWILSHPQFDSWLAQTRTSLLWLIGHSGCGKSTLLSFLAQHLEEAQGGTDAALVCIHFCDNKVMVHKNVLSILKSIIYQIICRHRSLVRHVKTVYEVQGRTLSRSFSSLWNIFERITSDPKSGLVYVLVDAPDECADIKAREIFLNSVAKLVHNAKSSKATHNCIKFLITSRPTLNEIRVSNGSLCG